MTTQIPYILKHNRNVGKNNIFRKAKKQITVYTDGACIHNGDPVKALAAIGAWYGDDDDRNISEILPSPPYTNQRAELYAVLAVLEANSLEDELLIYSDSKYAVQGISDWMYKWKEQKTLITRSNGDIWKRLYDNVITRNLHGLPIMIKHVRGHCGIEGNEKADKLATTAIDIHIKSNENNKLSIKEEEKK